MIRPTTVRVLSTRKQGPDTHIIELQKPTGFSHRAGQFVVIEIEVDGKPIRRSYSIASAPYEERLELAIKRQPHGRVSPVLCDLRVGDSVGLLGPYGRFLLPEGDGTLVLVAAGTGITPFMSYLRSLDREHSTREILLLSSNRVPEGKLYDKELQELSDRLSLTVHHTITRPHLSDQEWEGLSGRFDEQMLSELLPADIGAVCICGPTPMVSAVKRICMDIGIDKESIHVEKYGDITA